MDVHFGLFVLRQGLEGLDLGYNLGVGEVLPADSPCLFVREVGVLLRIF